MLLTKSNVQKIASLEVELPSAGSFNLPEKVLQFGTGVLLRGLPDYFFDKANKKGIFNGRVLVVKSTGNSGTDAFSDQDSLYTLCVKGIEDGKEVVRYVVNNSISRVLSAKQDWQKILEAAKNPLLSVVVSNTTEVGIVLSNDKVDALPPDSFPGKLLAFLYERYRYFKGSEDAGLVILPTELIPDNARKLKEILFQLSDQNNLENDFKDWLEQANDFCNTLVDRIVPGALPETEHGETEQLLGYKDGLMIMAEPFRLWAIETDSERVKQALDFAKVDDGVVLVPSIEKFKEIKLRLLNGTHTLSCAVALLGGFKTVKEAMANETFRQFVGDLMEKEIGESIIGGYIEKSDVQDFSKKVLDRFSNPYLEHKWASIALNYTSKMNMRNVGLLDKWYKQNEAAPARFALGFAAYLQLMDTTLSDNKYLRIINHDQVELQDEYAPVLQDYWQSPTTVVNTVLSDEALWGTDLTKYLGFEESVTAFLKEINEYGILATIKNLNVAWQVAY